MPTLSPQQVTRGPIVDKSSIDDREYRAISLSNSLDVLLVSDSTSENAAASMDVAVGSFSDPPELPGLAHFLEHMLFLGTEKYPDESSYNNFLAENGGSSNAYTSSEHTNYHFKIVVADKTTVPEPDRMPKFKEALDRFAQFFTAPLFTESAADRELNAVDSEHQKNLQRDSRRLYQVKKEIANVGHPYTNFGTGSKETLGTTPAEMGIDTRAALLEFHKTYYSANLMKLCILGPYSLDIMEKWVAELFSDIANHNRADPSQLYAHLQPLLPEHNGKMYYVESIKDIRHLHLSWMLPSYLDQYPAQVWRFLGSFLGDEGEGSIMSLLKKLAWCDSLTFGCHDQQTFTESSLTVGLTAEAVDHVDEIVEYIYKYIQMVRETGVQKRLYEDCKVMAHNRFWYMQKHNPQHFVVSSASGMQAYPPQDYLTGAHLFKEYRPELIHEILGYLTPENGNVFVSGKFVSDKVTRKAKWYETPYHVEDIEESKLKMWKNTKSIPELFAPAPNPFIPTELDILGEPLAKGKQDLEGPKLIFSNNLIHVHHKLDRTFQRPMVKTWIRLCSPLPYRSPLHCVLADLFTCLVEDVLTEYLYPAQRAGFHFWIQRDNYSIVLTFRGYSHRFDAFIEAILEKIKSFEADPVRFNMQKDSLQRHYISFDKNQPYSRAMYNCSDVLEEPHWHVSEYVERLSDDSVTVKSLNAYVKEMFERLFMEALFHGNISEESAISIAESTQSIFGCQPLPESEKHMKRVVQMPVGKDVFIRAKSANEDDNNSAIEVFFPVALRGDFVTDVRLELLGDILNKPAFHDLRTVQQLGYIVFEGDREIELVRGLFVIIQSTVADPDALLEKIDAFLEKARKDILEDMSDEVFQQYVSSMSANKAEPDTNVTIRTYRFWRELETSLMRYDRPQREIEVLQSVSKADLIEFFDTYIAKEGKSRRRIVSQIYGSKHPFEKRKALNGDYVEVQNAVAFRREHPLYPVVNTSANVYVNGSTSN